MGCGSTFTAKTSASSTWYTLCSMGSCAGVRDAERVNSSMRTMPFMPMFCVISTALVLHGVTISRRGPTQVPRNVSCAVCWASKSHSNLLIS